MGHEKSSGPLDRMGRWLSESDADASDIYAPVCVSDYHKHNHFGKAYTGAHIFSGTAAGAQQNLLLMCPADKVLSARFFVFAGADFQIRLYENPTVQVTGTAINIHNENRQRASAQPTDTLLFRDAGVNDLGTELTPAFVAGGSAAGPRSSPGGTFEDESEMILPPNNRYLLVVQNLTASAEYVCLGLQFYEDDPY